MLFKQPPAARRLPPAGQRFSRHCGSVCYSRSAASSTASRLGKGVTTLKTLSIFAAALSLYFAANKLYQCRTALFGAAGVGPAGDGAATSRRLADFGECVSQQRTRTV